MRETTRRHGSVRTKLKATVVALLAVFAFGALSAGSAQAAEQLDLEFNDAWIKVDSLAALTGGGIHALDPADTATPKIKMKGTLAPNGDFTGKKADFSFPDQVLDALGSQITLSITAASDYTGNYNRSTGALTGTLPLTLQIDEPTLIAVKCQISPMTIPLNTSGPAVDFGVPPSPGNPAGEPNLLSPAPFTGGVGQLGGSWTGVGLNQVNGIAAYDKTESQMTAACRELIGTFVPEGSTFDGSIWLKGTAAVSGTPDPTECKAGETGTPPNCVPVSAFKVSKVVVGPKKGKVKAGKSIKLKISVTNSGGTAGSAKVALKSTNKQVKVPKSVSISVAAGKTVTKTITVKAGKKAKGKATISAKAGSASGKSVLTVQKAKK